MIIKKENKGQLTIEFILILSLILILVISVNNTINKETELNLAEYSARNGVFEGISTSGLAIFSKESYDQYQINENKSTITNTKNIKLIKLKFIDQNTSSQYNKSKIQIKAYLNSDNVKTKEDKESVGDRINYNIRKSIAKSFKTENISNELFNPVFTNSYEFTTLNVEWV